MDEILIGEKKYISSKRAAKATGYAKDYIGQLCREGRVPARLVGRSWYVLESAIHDHRFGEGKVEQNDSVSTSLTDRSATWDAPRYEAGTVDGLPTIEKRVEETAPAAEPETPQHLHEAWRAWFDRVAINEPTALNTSVVQEERSIEVENKEDQSEPKEVKERGSESVNVPIRAVYERPPEELLPSRNWEAKARSWEEPKTVIWGDQETPISTGRRGIVAFQVAGAVVALFMAVAAVMGTGYFDTYILSIRPVSLLAGVILYNK